MRILIPAFDYKPQNGGVAAYTFELAMAFLKENCEVLILAPDHAHAYEFDKNHPLRIIRYSRSKKAFFNLSIIRVGLQEAIKDFNPDIIFSPLWFPDGAATVAALKQLKLSIPLFIAAHGTELTLPQNSLSQTIRRILLQKKRNQTFHAAKKIFAVSRNTKNIICNDFPDLSEKIVVVSNGVNLDVFKKINSTPVAAHYPQLLTVSRLIPTKGIDSVLYALPELIKTYPHLTYTVIGQGPDRDRLVKITKNLQLQNIVTFKGYQTQDEIVNAYNSHDLFVLLSQNKPPHIEGFGLVFLEAAACGLPSLGAHSGGIPDAIIDKKTGWLTDTTAPNTTKILSEILSSPEELKKMGQAAWENAQQKTWQNSVQKILESIHESL